jgi:hypothetical protein
MVKSYVGDIGTRVRTKVCADITNVSGVWYNVMKPDNTEVEWTCIVEDYTQGIIYYDVQAATSISLVDTNIKVRL